MRGRAAARRGLPAMLATALQSRGRSTRAARKAGIGEREAVTSETMSANSRRRPFRTGQG